jgi:hypothetical protein
VRILILSELFDEKYHQMISDIIGRHKKITGGNVEFSVVSIASRLQIISNFSPVNKFTVLLTRRDQKFHHERLENYSKAGINYTEIEFTRKANSAELEKILAQVLLESADTSFSTIHQSSKSYRKYMYVKRVRFEREISNLIRNYVNIVCNINYERIFIPSGKNSWTYALDKVAGFYSPNSKIFYYDAFGSEKRYFCESYKPTDLKKIQQAILETTIDSKNSELEAMSWFTFQKNSKSQNYNVNHDGYDPKGKKFRYTFFSSSEDEFFGLKDWSDSNFQNQYNGFFDVSKFLFQHHDNECEIIIRYHPHNKIKSVSENIKIVKSSILLASIGCTILFPNSSVSATSLITNSDKVVTWNSTVGVEAAYLGTRSYHLAKSMYSLLGCSQLISQPSEVLINANRESARLDALRYGLYMAKTSFPIEYSALDQSHNKSHHFLFVIYKIILKYLTVNTMHFKLFFRIKINSSIYMLSKLFIKLMKYSSK